MVERLLSFLESDVYRIEESQLAGALSLALCYINRMRTELSSVRGRILVLDAASEGAYSPQYVVLMNLAYTASNENVLIDSCGLATNPAAITEHVSEITGGVHLRFSSLWPANPKLAKDNKQIAGDCLTQFLLFHYMTSGRARAIIAPVTEKTRPNTIG
eukprot:GHVS01101219.1.p1 GENE.GHVS01101219.1~~GHVS01101219.1.p1  ORF type:complete len:159 (+),score=6.10 GHVS01101219.1:114-590(+)